MRGRELSKWHPGELYPRVGFVVTNMARPAENVVAFYNKRGTCEQWIKEGKAQSSGHGSHVGRLPPTPSVPSFMHSPTISATACARWRRPNRFKDWLLTSLKEKLIKIGAKVISHGRYVAFQMAEVAIPRTLFANILRLIAELRPPLITSTA
jgi:Transposase DDE domain group 1